MSTRPVDGDAAQPDPASPLRATAPADAAHPTDQTDAADAGYGPPTTPAPGSAPYATTADPTASGTETGPATDAATTAALARQEHRLQVGAEALPQRVPWRHVIVFLVIAFAAAWAVCIPFWSNPAGLEGVDPGLMQLLLLCMMATPTLAALIVVFLVQRPKHPVSLLGLRVRPIGRTLLLCAIAWVAPGVLFFLGALLAGALGIAPIDLSGERFREVTLEMLATTGSSPDVIAVYEAMPAGLLVALTLLQAITVSVFMSSIPAFGEELGWRGWLLPALRPLGTWPAIIISSVIWGLWHAPIILLGYNFADRGPLGLVMMIGFCVAIGPFCSWVRLRSASVYPAAIAHGSINAFASTIAIVFIADLDVVDPKQAIVGWTAWVPFILLAVVLVLLGQFRKQPLPGLTLAQSAMALERAKTAAPSASGDAAIG